MKIAIPTNDGLNITSNTKFLKGFKTFEISEGKVLKESFITGIQTAHPVLASLGSSEHSIADNPLLEAIHDCKIVISNGLDKNLFEDLMRAHKEVYVTEASDVRAAIRRFIHQTLKNHPELCGQ
jgi:predicted Fe-Mo cluster-binding NifX family protein